MSTISNNDKPYNTNNDKDNNINNYNINKCDESLYIEYNTTSSTIMVIKPYYMFN